jgi:5-hydroxyisourate hydrolase-like protein (transthyretin family)
LLEEGIVSTKNLFAESLNLTIFPNPINALATVQYQLEKAGKVKAELVDLNGRVVKNLFNENLNTGDHEFTFEVNDLSSGNYFLRMSSGNGTTIEKIAVVK